MVGTAAGVSGVEGIGTPVVFLLRGCDDDLQLGEAKAMAKGTGRARPGAGTGGDRSCGGRRRAPVEDGNDDTLQEKFANDVREVSSDVGKRERDQEGAAQITGAAGF